MKVLLCSFHSSPYPRGRHFGFPRNPLVGLGYIASSLQQDDHEVRIVDDYVLSPAAIREEIRRFRPDVVGVEVFTASFRVCSEWAQDIRRECPGARVVFGGPHPTTLPEVTAKVPAVDAIVLGEGEATMRRLLAAWGAGREPDGIPGLRYRSADGSIVDNGPPEPIEDLDALPCPAFDLMNLDAYLSSGTQRATGSRCTTAITSRGCRYRCAFCGQPFGHRVRLRSPENVVSELEILIRDHDVHEVVYVDDDFATDPGRAAAICDLIVDRGIRVTWHVHCRVDTVSRALMQRMADAGCRSVFFGVESGAQSVLDAMGKRESVEQIEEAVRLAKETIGWVNCGVVFGMPGETHATAEATVRLVRRMDPMIVNYHFAVPMPGSPLFVKAVEEGLIDKDTVCWDDFDITSKGRRRPVAAFSELTREELLALVKRTHREFYFRPAYVLRLIRKFHEPWTWRYIWMGVQEVVKHQWANRGWRGGE